MILLSRLALTGRSILSLAAIHWLAGCTLLPIGGSPSGTPGGSPVLGGKLHEYRAVFHCHTYLSHDSDGSVEEIARAARDLGVQAVLLTDHYAPGNLEKSPRGMVDDVLFIPGVEARAGRKGSLLIVGAARDFDPDSPRENLLAELESQGAFLVAGHVEKMTEDHDFSPYGGFEVYNLHAEFTAASGWAIAGRFFFYPPDAFFEAAISPPLEKLERWDRLLEAGHKLAPLAAQDAHANIRVFGPLGGIIGTYAELFRLFSTRILATELSEPALMEALHHGRTYVIFDYLSRAGYLRFRYGSPSWPVGQFSTMGDTVAFAPDHRFEVSIPETATIRVVRGGKLLREDEGRELRFRAPGPGVYRVEVWRCGKLWMLSGPIYLTDEASTR